MPKVSVIVPVYNTARYLERCVSSIRSQTLEDIEIILVDDGSTDESPALCDRFAELDERIVVVHKANGGLSSARNAGIKASTGEYLGYVDSDDYIDSAMYQELYDCAVTHNVNFVMEDYWRISCDGKRHKKTLDIRSGLYTKDDIRAEIYPLLIMRECVDYGPLLSVWHCLYNARFVKDNGLYFDESVLWSEDCIYSAILGYVAESFFYLKQSYGYCYCENGGSITTSFKPKAWDVYCLMNKKLRLYFEGRDDFDFSRQLKLHMLYFACSYLGQLRLTGFTFKEKYDIRRRVLLSEPFQSAMKGFSPSKDLGLKFRVMIWLMKNKAILLLSILDRP